jgi:hypothetical protein
MKPSSSSTVTLLLVFKEALCWLCGAGSQQLWLCIEMGHSGLVNREELLVVTYSLVTLYIASVDSLY